MSTSIVDSAVVDVRFDAERLHVVLRDGREVSIPITRFPRLASADDDARADWRLIGRGDGIHWPRVDEDISVAGLLRTS